MVSRIIDKSKKSKLQIIKHCVYIITFFLITLSFIPVIHAENTNIEILIPTTYELVDPGADIWFTINLLSLGNENRRDILLISQIVDGQEKVLAEKTKTVAVETQASFVNDIKVPSDTLPGNYYVFVKAVYDNTTLSARHQFSVKSPDFTMYYYAAILLFGIIVIGLLIWLYISKKDTWALHSKIKSIIKKKLKK
jgi:uncharacterized membrane protein